MLAGFDESELKEMYQADSSTDGQIYTVDLHLSDLNKGEWHVAGYIYEKVFS